MEMVVQGGCVYLASSPVSLEAPAVAYSPCGMLKLPLSALMGRWCHKLTRLNQ